MAAQRVVDIYDTVAQAKEAVHIDAMPGCSCRHLG